MASEHAKEPRKQPAAKNIQRGTQCLVVKRAMEALASDSSDTSDDIFYGCVVCRVENLTHIFVPCVRSTHCHLIEPGYCQSKSYIIQIHLFCPTYHHQGHYCICKTCSDQIMEDNMKCPMCNEVSTLAMKVLHPARANTAPVPTNSSLKKDHHNMKP